MSSPFKKTRVEIVNGIQDGGFAVILRRYKCPVCGDAPGWTRCHYTDSGWDRSIEAWNEYAEGKKQAINNDLISRDVALKKIAEYFKTTDPKGEEQLGVLTCHRLIRELPAVDAEPVRHGRWEVNMVTDYMAYPAYTYKRGYKCSLCGREERTNKEPYCHCGAKMDLKMDKEEDNVRKAEKRDR